jgi:hypothetical protein
LDSGPPTHDHPDDPRYHYTLCNHRLDLLAAPPATTIELASGPKTATDLIVDVLRYDPDCSDAFAALSTHVTHDAASAVMLPDGRELTKAALLLEALRCDTANVDALHELGLLLKAVPGTVVPDHVPRTPWAAFVRVLELDDAHADAYFELAECVAALPAKAKPCERVVTLTVEGSAPRTLTQQELLLRAAHHGPVEHRRALGKAGALMLPPNRCDDDAAVDVTPARLPAAVVADFGRPSRGPLTPRGLLVEALRGAPAAPERAASCVALAREMDDTANAAVTLPPAATVGNRVRYVSPRLPQEAMGLSPDVVNKEYPFAKSGVWKPVSNASLLQLVRCAPVTAQTALGPRRAHTSLGQTVTKRDLLLMAIDADHGFGPAYKMLADTMDRADTVRLPHLGDGTVTRAKLRKMAELAASAAGE